jgi:hypothetical protein
MSVIDRLASQLGRSDEAPNQALARDLAARRDNAGIAEVAGHLWQRDQAIRSDCIKVLYEIGEIDPALIAPFAADFVRLLSDKQNRLVWGAMTALGTIASIEADAIYTQVREIEAAIERGSVITVDHGIKVLAKLAVSSPERNTALFPRLLQHLATCRSKEVPQHSESTLIAVTATNRDAFVLVLDRRMPELTASQASRVKRTIKRAHSS